MHTQRQLITLANAHKVLHTVSNNYHDEVIEVTPAISFSELTKLETSKDTYTLQPTAQKQICARLGIPQMYLEKCSPNLQGLNLDFWLQQFIGKKLFLRMDSNEIRAIFTTRYKPINNIDIINELVTIYKSETPVEFIHHNDVMALSIPQAEKIFDLGPGDYYQPGVSIINSETGYRAFSIEAFILRLVCTNGLIRQVPAAFKKVRHVVSDFFDRFCLPQIISNVLDSTQEIKVDLVQAQRTVYEDPYEVMGKINKRFQLAAPEVDAALWGFLQEPGVSLYHLINGYTRGAQFPGLPEDSQYRLEYTGGMISGLAVKEHAIVDRGHSLFHTTVQ